MRTSIDLPDDVFHRAKIVAAQRKTTLRELVLIGLDYATRTESVNSEQLRLNRAQALLDALQADNSVPMHPLTREELHDRTL